MNADSFIVRIELGNDAMQTAEQIAVALEDVGDSVRQGFVSGPITDYNGNTVGKFAYEESGDDGSQ